MDAFSLINGMEMEGYWPSDLHFLAAGVLIILCAICAWQSMVIRGSDNEK